MRTGERGRYRVPMEEAGRWALLDERLPAHVREAIEDRLWRPIGAQATLEILVADPAFLADPGTPQIELVPAVAGPPTDPPASGQEPVPAGGTPATAILACPRCNTPLGGGYLCLVPPNTYPVGYVTVPPGPPIYLPESPMPNVLAPPAPWYNPVVSDQGTSGLAPFVHSESFGTHP